MKYLVNLKLASALVGGVLISMLCGCDDADYKVIDNAVYLSEAYSNPGLSKKISIDTESSIAVTGNSIVQHRLLPKIQRQLLELMNKPWILIIKKWYELHPTSDR